MFVCACVYAFACVCMVGNLIFQYWVGAQEANWQLMPLLAAFIRIFSSYEQK